MLHSYANAVGAYQQAAIPSSPQIAVVRLYDEAIKRIRRASKRVADGRMEEAHSDVSRASSIFLGLMSILDFDQDADLATALKQTYLSNIMALHDGFGKPDMNSRYDILLEGLTELRNSWAQIAGVSELSPKKE